MVTDQDKVVADLNVVRKSIDDIVSMEDFIGEAATTVKNYFTDIHQMIIAVFKELFMKIHENVELRKP